MEYESTAIIRVLQRALGDEKDVACWELSQVPFEHPKYYDPVSLLTSWCSHASVLMRRSAYEKVGGYEKRLFMYGEDVELSYRFRAAGYKLRYCPDCVVAHFTYASEAEFKPVQFEGSISANVLIRARFGQLRDALAGIVNVVALRMNAGDKLRRKLLDKSLRKIAKNYWNFFSSRRRGDAFFPFRGFDYELSRDGAFFVRNRIFQYKPLVSVITRTIEGREYLLRECIASVINQTYSNIEHIVVQDRGESAAELVSKVAREYQGHTIRFLRSDKGGAYTCSESRY